MKSGVGLKLNDEMRDSRFSFEDSLRIVTVSLGASDIDLRKLSCPLKLPIEATRHSNTTTTTTQHPFKMITDEQLYSLAVFCGSAAVLLIVLYHFLEINSDEAHAKSTTPLSEVLSSKAGGKAGVVKVGEKEFVGVRAGGLGVAQ